MNALLKVSAGIPELYQNCALENFSVKNGTKAIADQLTKARQITQWYIDEFLLDNGEFASSGLLFAGPAGTGKTHLAIAVLVELMRRYGLRGKFVEFSQLIYSIQTTFETGAEESRSRVLDPIVESQLLVLDDIGNSKKPSPFALDTLFYLINSRYIQRRPTLFTTNCLLSPIPQKSRVSGELVVSNSEQLASRVGESLASRMLEMARPVILDAAPDWRRGKTWTEPVDRSDSL